MPRVERVAGPRVYTRRVAREFTRGDTADVTEADAVYLVEELGGFERVDGVDGDGDADGTADDADVCDEVKTDGEVCGRDLPCPYHSDDEGADEPSGAGE